MDVREKLVELLRNAKAAMKSENLSCNIARNGFVADFLIANGVTVQRWIPVTERMPSETRVIDGEEYIKHVAVIVRGVPFEVIAFYDEEYDCWFDDDFLPVAGEVTHWMPLPKPPKEGE